MDSPDLQAAIRPLVLLLCQAGVCVGIYLWNIFSISNIFYVVIALLPLGWLLGLLPPPDTFLLWFGEQVSLLIGQSFLIMCSDWSGPGQLLWWLPSSYQPSAAAPAIPGQLSAVGSDHDSCDQ